MRPLLRMACPISFNSPEYKTLHNLYSQAFDELGYNYILLQRTAERSRVELNDNVIDAECARIKEFESEPSAPIKVDVIIHRITYALWGYDTTLNIANKEALLSHPYKIGYISGHLSAERFINNNKLPNVFGYPTQAIALRQLAQKEIDLLFSSPALIEVGLRRQPELSAPRQLLTLYSADLYPYLSRKNAHLKEPLEKALRKLLQTDRQN